MVDAPVMGNDLTLDGRSLDDRRRRRRPRRRRPLGDALALAFPLNDTDVVVLALVGRGPPPLALLVPNGDLNGDGRRRAFVADTLPLGNADAIALSLLVDVRRGQAPGSPHHAHVLMRQGAGAAVAGAGKFAGLDLTLAKDERPGLLGTGVVAEEVETVALAIAFAVGEADIAIG
jgi:hypothetical protein